MFCILFLVISSVYPKSNNDTVIKQLVTNSLTEIGLQIRSVPTTGPPELTYYLSINNVSRRTILLTNPLPQ